MNDLSLVKETNVSFDKIVSFIRILFDQPEGFISLHEPRFEGNEKNYVLDAIDSTFVSSVGKYVDQLENMICEYTGAKYAIACVNGTASLHMCLMLAGVKRDEVVITQPLSFVATCNAISYIGAEPLFVDIDKKTLSLSAEKLEIFFKEKTEIKNNNCYHKESGKRIAACVPMHTFGHPAEIDTLVSLCEYYKVPLVEDAAESIGSKYKGKQTGTFGLMGTFSFNGNKTVTCGGGGCIITNDESLAKQARHLTKQAKVSHRWEFVHDQIGYNYRMPNLNAALACAQMEQLDTFIANKRNTALAYQAFFSDTSISFIKEPEHSYSNYWLNAILLNDRKERDDFLKFTNDRQILARPAWALMPHLEMFKKCICENIENAIDIESRMVNLPSSVRPE